MQTMKSIKEQSRERFFRGPSNLNLGTFNRFVKMTVIHNIDKLNYYWVMFNKQNFSVLSDSVCPPSPPERYG